MQRVSSHLYLWIERFVRMDVMFWKLIFFHLFSHQFGWFLHVCEKKNHGNTKNMRENHRNRLPFSCTTQHISLWMKFFFRFFRVAHDDVTFPKPLYCYVRPRYVRFIDSAQQLRKVLQVNCVYLRVHNEYNILCLCVRVWF